MGIVLIYKYLLSFCSCGCGMVVDIGIIVRWDSVNWSVYGMCKEWCMKEEIV